MKSILNYPGSKWSYADWIVSHFPAHKMYLEPYFGSGAVFFNKPAAKYETINDIDGNVVNYFTALRDHPDELAHAISLTPYARDEYRAAQEPGAGKPLPTTGDCVEDARRFAVRSFMAFGGKQSDRCGWKNKLQPKASPYTQAWGNLPDAILVSAKRLKNAQIENANAVELIKSYNGADCLIYADPPYLGEVRSNKRMYRHEMMDHEQHIELLTALKQHKGPVVVSGYQNDLYNEMLAGWDQDTMNGTSNNAGKRTEVLWYNFELQQRFC